MQEERMENINLYREDRDSWEDLLPSEKWEVFCDLHDLASDLESAKEEIEELRNEVVDARRNGALCVLEIVHAQHGGQEIDPLLCQSLVCADARKRAGFKA